MMKNSIVIMGATSGLGYSTAKIFQDMGWTVGVAGRRQEQLDRLVARAPERTFSRSVDINSHDAAKALTALADDMGGMAVYLHCSGTGNQNLSLDPDVELRTVTTNAEGFTRMLTAAYRYFANRGGGHVTVISSIAGTKGLGAAPAYSATKRFQNTYIDALEQLAWKQKLDISFTDIRPGFVRTALLGDKHYPMLMQPEYVARRIVNAILCRRRRVVIDWRYSLLVFFWRLIPGRVWPRFNAFN